MIASLPSTDTADLIDLQQRAQQWQKDNMPDYMFYSGESLAVMWAYLGKEAVVDGGKGALLALVLISLILMLVFRSFKYGIISLIPNLLPAGVGYGLWAVVNGELSMGQIMVLSITIGIVVDAAEFDVVVKTCASHAIHICEREGCRRVDDAQLGSTDDRFFSNKVSIKINLNSVARVSSVLVKVFRIP